MKKNWLYGKTVIISGASGGIGFSCAKTLIEKYDCNVIGIARNEEKLLKNRQTLGDKQNKFSYRLFDVGVYENWVDFKNYLESNGIIPDVLFNNAGFMLPFKKYADYDTPLIDEIVKTNLCSVLYSTKVLMPLLKKSPCPSVVNLASSAGLCPVVGESLYCTTKYAVRGFTETLMQDYPKKELYVCGIYPGFIKTNIVDRMNLSEKNGKIVGKLMMPLDKATKKIVKGLSRRKKRIVFGFDGKSLSFGGRFMPNLFPALMRKVLKTSGLDLFDGVFGKKTEK